MRNDGVNKDKESTSGENLPPYLPPKNQLNPTAQAILLEVQNHPRNFSLKGTAKKMGKASSTTREHLQKLRDIHGLVFKDDKDVCSMWVLTERGKAYLRGEVELKSSRVTPFNPQTSPLQKPNNSRGHGFQIKFSVPNNKTTKRWNDRLGLFEGLGIKYKPLSLFGGGQGIVLKGHKIHLTNNSIIIYSTHSFLEELVRESDNQAINYFFKLVKQIEDLFNVKFRDAYGQYIFRVTRSHFAMIKNVLARQYNEKKQKLEVYLDKGMCLVIDDSFGVGHGMTGEFEVLQNKATHEDTVDTAEKVQVYLKDQDSNGWITTSQIRAESDKRFREAEERILKLSEQNIQLTQVLEQMSNNLVKLTGEVYKNGKG